MQDSPKDPGKSVFNFQSKKSLFSNFSFASNKAIYIIVGILVLASTGSSVYILSLPNTSNLASANVSTFSKNVLVTVPPTVEASLQPTYAAAAATETPTLTPTPSTTTIENWNTYINKQYNYSIQYPMDWTVQNQGQLSVLIPNFVVFNPNSASGSANSVTISYSTRTYQQDLTLNPQAGTPITVASVSGTQKVLQDSDGNTTISIMIPLANNNSIIFNANQLYKNIFNTMLTTFSFNQ